MLHSVILIFVVCSACLWGAEASDSTASNVRVLALLSTSKDSEGQHVIFCGVGFDITGQVLYLRRFDNRDKARSFIKFGKSFVNYVSVRLENDVKGNIEFNFEECTVGSSVDVMDKEGNVKDVFSLPKGVFADLSKSGYFANIRVSSVEKLPLKELVLDSEWASPEALKLLEIQ